MRKIGGLTSAKLTKVGTKVEQLKEKIKTQKKEEMPPKVIKAALSKGYDVFEQDDKPFNLNILAV